MTSETRIDAVVVGQADLECGSTTNNLERQKQVAFSPTIFVSGTKLLVKKRLADQVVPRPGRQDGGRDRRHHEREGDARARAASSSSTSAWWSRATMPQSFAQLEAGKADAFATDDVLLYGLDRAAQGAAASYQVVGEFLSYDPYGIMFRKGDAQLAELVNDTFHDLAEDGEIERQYKRWFLRSCPPARASTCR